MFIGKERIQNSKTKRLVGDNNCNLIETGNLATLGGSEGEAVSNTREKEAGSTVQKGFYEFR